MYSVVTGVIGIAVLALVAFGAYALYRYLFVTPTPPPPTPSPSPSPQPSPTPQPNVDYCPIGTCDQGSTPGTCDLFANGYHCALPSDAKFLNLPDTNIYSVVVQYPPGTSPVNPCQGLPTISKIDAVGLAQCGPLPQNSSTFSYNGVNYYTLPVP